ncbi:MAG: endo-1,4-beta-xylanase, partial [Armatimonadetes bacterium]|nr:endo-1,4-beta-xylanase [Armatimonadota bacterium]
MVTTTLLACALGVAAIADPKDKAMDTLRALAAKRGITVGTCVSTRFLTEEPYAKLAGEQFSLLEPENELKFGSVHPEQGKYDFAPVDAQWDFAQKHKMKMRGHTLVWHNQVANWVRAGKYTPEQLNQILKDHIFTVMRRYAGKIRDWDVVNEAVADDAKMRSDLWYDKPGIGFAGQGHKYIEQAFRWAHEADPKARLFYNDYSIEWIGPKSDAVYAMLKDMLAHKVPVHGMGMQCHMDFQFDNDGAIKSFRENIRR